MKSKDKRPQDAADSGPGSVQAGQDDLRQHAEARAREEAAQFTLSGAEGSEDVAALSPEEIRQALHELRVHQIELEMQNEELRAAQAALEASRERYFDLYDTAPVGYFTLSEQGLILEANLTAATLLGVTRSALIKQPISHFIHQEDQDIYYMHRKKLFETYSTSSAGEPRACELRLVKPDGATFWAHLVATVAQAPSTSSPQASPGGELAEPSGQADEGAPVCRVTLSDVTERKQVEEALESERAFLSAVFDNIQEAIIICNQEGRISRFNEAARRLHALPEQPIPLDQWAEHYDLYQADGMTPLPVADIPLFRALQGELVHAAEIVVAPKHSRPRFLVCSGQALTDKSGRKLGAIVTMHDITARKQAEEERALLTAEIRGQAQQMAQVLATVPAGVLLLDAEGQILRANPVAEDYLSILTGPAMGDALTRLGDRPLAELLTSPPIKGLWHKIKTDDRTFEAMARPVENGPKPEQWVLVINDVTREREIQAQLQQQAQLAAVGQLAAGIAHDFNNIIAVIVLYTQMGLSMPDTSPQLRERLEIISQQARRATDLIQQILDFGRRAVLDRRPMDMSPFLKEVAKLLERTMPENIKVKLSYGQDEYIVNADPVRMQQAIMNLVTNARDAMPSQGDGELRVALSRTTATDKIRCVTCGQVIGEEWVCIAVTDSGSGIPPKALPHMFEPFFTTKDVGQGTGLGLSQVYGIVKQHEGHIDLTTQVGQGTTFTIYLPALQMQLPAAPAIERQVAIRGQGETVLVVEDNAALRGALVDILELLNYRALQAANGREALAVLEQRADEIALVLSDLVMPEMGGQALFHAMQQCGLTLPMVMLSGHPMESELEALQAQGLAGWMLKPLDEKQLSQLLARALN